MNHNVSAWLHLYSSKKMQVTHYQMPRTALLIKNTVVPHPAADY